MKKKVLLLTFLLATCVMSRFWTGIYHHDEYAETHFFVKHRPIWKWEFNSPIGQSDLKLKDLTEAEREEELLFEEFVSSKGMSK